MNKNPCWKCGNRCVGCHGSCAAYKTWREGYDVEKAKTEVSKRSANDYIATRGWLPVYQDSKVGCVMMKRERIMAGAIGVLTVASIGIGCRAYMLKPEPHDVSVDRMTTMPEEVWKPEYDIPATEYAYITDEQLAEIEAQEAQSVEDALLASATRIDNVTVTHYCICQKCCGKSPDHPAYGITASGRYATPYVSVAVDPSVIPLGSDVLVDYGDSVIQYYRADDTGSGVGGKHIDLCVSDHQEARNLGVRTATVYVVPPEN